MDVKEILETKNITYKSRGRDYTVRCLNPEHEDVHPSMNIDKVSGLFICPSCGFSGDIYKYFKINKEKYIESKATLLIEKIQKLQAEKSLTYPLDMIPFKDSFRGISGNTYKKFNAFTTKERGLEGRLVFPIIDINGNIKVFQGRYMYSDLDPKYKVYPRDRTIPLFPQLITPINRSIILVEGLFDMLNMHDKGLTNTVCTFGTMIGQVKKTHKQKLNIEKLLLYKYLGTDKLYIMFDGDDAGRSAAYGLEKYIKTTFVTQILDLEDGKDPGTLDTDYIYKLKGELYEQ